MSNTDKPAKKQRDPDDEGMVLDPATKCMVRPSQVRAMRKAAGTPVDAPTTEEEPETEP